MIDNDRLKHSISITRKMVEIGKREEFNEEEISDLFLLGFIHDIGYDARLEDIKSRYGEDSVPYKNIYN